jgi:Transposase DDE domain
LFSQFVGSSLSRGAALILRSGRAAFSPRLVGRVFGRVPLALDPPLALGIGDRVFRLRRGHNYPNRFKVWISGQVRRVTKAIRREMRRRAAIEPVIGHLKEDHRMGRNYLTGRHGDRINAVLAAAGYNFSLLLRWFEELLRVLSLILCHALLAVPLHLTRCRKTFFTAD